MKLERLHQSFVHLAKPETRNSLKACSMCDNEAFEFAEVSAADAAEAEAAEPPATAREVSIDMSSGGSWSPAGAQATRGDQFLLVQRQQTCAPSGQRPRRDEVDKLTLSARDLTVRSALSADSTYLQPPAPPPLALHQPIRCLSAIEGTLEHSEADAAAAEAANARKAASAKPSARPSVADDPEASKAAPHVGLASQLAAALHRAPQRLSFVDRARAYRQHPQQSHQRHRSGCHLPDDARVFGQLLEPVPYCGAAGGDSAAASLLSIEQLHNLIAERRHVTAIVDCREEGETSRLDLSHLVAFSARDLLEADSLQLERINKGLRYLVLVSTLATCSREDLLTLRRELTRHMQLCCNSCGLSVHVLDCDVNLAAYLGGGSPVPTVFEDSIYLIAEQHFVLSADSLSLYEAVLTDSKAVEKFCHFQSARRVTCLRLGSFADDVEAALWLMRGAEERDECALLCFGCQAVGKALVVAYTMWKHRHLMRDAVQRVRDAWAIAEFDSARERELVEIEKRLFCQALA